MSKDYNNEILNDCAWFAEKHRGKNTTSGPHWSTIIRFPKLFDEATRLQNLVSAYENDLVLLDVTEKLKKAEARVQKLEQERRWIPVSEQLPEDSRIYDVAIAGYEYSWTGSLVFGKWIGESGKAILGVTHWKYRPQTPEVTRWKPQPPQEK